MLLKRLIGQALERPWLLGKRCLPQTIHLHFLENGGRQRVLLSGRELGSGIKGFLELIGHANNLGKTSYNSQDRSNAA